MTVKITHFNTSLLLILIGMNYTADLLHCFFVMSVGRQKKKTTVRSLSNTHTQITHSGKAVFTS